MILAKVRGQSFPSLLASSLLVQPLSDEVAERKRCACNVMWPLTEGKEVYTYTLSIIPFLSLPLYCMLRCPASWRQENTHYLTTLSLVLLGAREVTVWVWVGLGVEGIRGGSKGYVCVWGVNECVLEG